ncbi:MAG: hypothetical protein IPL67_10085 [Ignavibacteria bacterium]|nr:hypothetical protein [Ignavibacteria bacterium]
MRSSGQNWTILSGGYFDLHGSYFVNSNTGWCVGEEGTLQKTTNGGSNWSFYPQLTREVLREVVFPSPEHRLHLRRRRYLKDDKCRHKLVSSQQRHKINLFDVFFLNNQTGILAGDTFHGIRLE